MTITEAEALERIAELESEVTHLRTALIEANRDLYPPIGSTGCCSRCGGRVIGSRGLASAHRCPRGPEWDRLRPGDAISEEGLRR